MNITTLKAQAEAARSDSVELELWRESIEVDEYLRLVEVARAAEDLLANRLWMTPENLKAQQRLIDSMRDIKS